MINPSTDQEPLAGPVALVQENPPRAKWNLAPSAFLALAGLAGVGAGYLLWGRRTSFSPSPAVAPGQGAVSQVTTRLDVSPDDDPALGPPDAPVVMIEFGDFQCPYCTKFHRETFRPLMATYPDSLRFVYRDFPVLGPESVDAAMAADCAGEQGRYWEFYDRLFSGGLELGRATYLRYTEEVALDVALLTDCLDSGLYRDEVLADASAAAALGVTGTPTFFINGLPLVGAQPLSAFVQVVDQELSR